MTWIQTFTGRQFYPLAPNGDQVCIEDIAHALSMKCRFNGHCRVFYSVAEHSLRVMDRVRELGGDPQTCLAALLHDAAEAYLPDVSRPIKGLCDFWNAYEDTDQVARYRVSFKHAENALLACIFGTLGVGMNVDEDHAKANQLIKHADNELLATEARDLMAPPPADWVSLPHPLRGRITRTMSPSEAEADFLLAWRDAQ